MTYQEYMDQHQDWSEEEQYQQHNALYFQLVTPSLTEYLKRTLGPTLKDYKDKRHWNDRGVLEYWDKFIPMASLLISDSKRRKLGICKSPSTYICVIKAAVSQIWAKQQKEEALCP
jgi:hypothetical protein